MDKDELVNMYNKIEESKKDEKYFIEKAEKWDKLLENSLFKELVLEDYFVYEAARVVAGVENDSIHDSIKAKMERQMLGIGRFQDYIRVIKLSGQNALDFIEKADEEIDAINKELGE